MKKLFKIVFIMALWILATAWLFSIMPAHGQVPAPVGTGTKIVSPVVPQDDVSMSNGTHYSNWGVGGLHNVTHYSQMDSIYILITNQNQETKGTLCYVADSSKYYIYNGATWDELESGKWQSSGNDIYYNSGKVGIGVTNPDEALDINGNFKLRGNNIYSSNGSHILNIYNADAYSIGIGNYLTSSVPSISIGRGARGSQYQVAIGDYAGRNAGGFSVFLGYRAGYNVAYGNTHSLMLGYMAGYDETAGNVMYLANDRDNGTRQNTWLFGSSSYDVEVPNGSLAVKKDINADGSINSTGELTERNIAVCRFRGEGEPTEDIQAGDIYFDHGVVFIYSVNSGWIKLN